MWTFGRRIAAGFGLTLLLMVIIGVVAYFSIVRLADTSRAVAHSHVVLERLADVLAKLIDAETGQRGFVITGDDAFLETYRSGSTSVVQSIKQLRTTLLDDPAQRQLLEQAEPLVTAKLDELARSIEVRRSGGFEAAARLVSSGEGKRYMDDLRRVLGRIEVQERGRLEQRAREVQRAESNTTWTIVLTTLFTLAVSVALGFLLTRSLGRHIGTAVGQVQSSSAELQAAATQQATGSKEQATAMSEISTTMNELLATSRQISESAGRVSQIAEQAGNAARQGDRTIETAHESIVAIRQQVDLIVSHMLQLGEQSQKIGAVLDIVSELAEQTNILAINATIEAAGAGEAGKRFAVVAEEIRKLADRVAGSTKEIRALIEGVRGAVNTTVMVTETGSKAADTGSKQFGLVAVSFKRIADLVVTATEASREIELSTKQQMSAVEQVNVAISGVAQTSRETEASSGQTLQTAGHLADLSRNLLRVVQAERTA